MASTITIRDTLDFVRIYPSLSSVFGNAAAGYGGNAIPIRIANKVLQEVLSKPFAWKWNRRVPASFLTNSLQQDYSTSITDLGWIENGTRTDINSGIIPPPIRGMEVVRELLPTSTQFTPSQLSWVPNSEALCGVWATGVVFKNPLGLQSMATQPLTQVRDSNGNIQVLTTYGTTGTTVPTWSTTANTTTADGTCVWTMADPNGITWRLSPCPPQNGIVWQIQPYYQKKATIFTQIGQVWTIPDEMSNVFEQGFLAWGWDAAEETARFEKQYAVFRMKIQEALGGADREMESFSLYPSRSLCGNYGSGLSRGDNQTPPGLF
jgi:hypothetical protein